MDQNLEEILEQGKFQKASKRGMLKLNAKEFDQCVDECEKLLVLCNKTNSSLSSFILTLFILCLLLIISYLFIGASIVFQQFSYSGFFLVFTIPLNNVMLYF